MTRPRIRLRKTARILEGAVLRIRWMFYKGDFPARKFLRTYPEDMQEFLWRCEEMANYGSIAMKSRGHQLHGKDYRELHQFNMPLTRSWGFITGNVYIVVYAETKKKKKEQEADYKKALRLREDFLNGPENH